MQSYAYITYTQSMTHCINLINLASFYREIFQMSLPLAKRYEIVFLKHHPLGPKMSKKAISRHINSDPKTVRYWLDRWEENEDLSDLPITGRPRATPEKIDAKIISIAQKERDIVSGEISKKLKKNGVDVSSRTVRRRLRENGGSYGPPLMKPLLTEAHREKRLLWARQHKRFNWDNVVFTDEKTFELHRGGKKVWRLPGTTKIVRKVKHPPKLHVWGCFSKRGFGQLICFKQNLNGTFMCNIYERGLLPTAQRQFPEGPGNWIL
jgi:transposase